MSYILDALRKAEQERKLGQPPTIMSIAGRDKAEKKHHYRFWFLLIIVVNTGVLFIFWPSPPVQQSFSTIDFEKQNDTRVEKTAPDVMSAQIVQSESPAPYESYVAEPAITDRLAEPAPEIDFSQRVTLANDALTTKPPPLLRALAPRIRDGIGPLNLDIHVYSELAEKRFVLINSVRYQQGDWLNEGPLLEAITEEGVILNHREQRFRLVVQR